jgi:hypothetical protein
MRYAILDENNKVTNIAKSDKALHDNWIDGTGAKIGDTWDGEQFITPEPEPEPVKLDVLSVDRWTIPADGTTEAVATYTSNDPVKFIIDGQVVTVDPVEQVCTLEISADAAGPIPVQVKDKQFVIVAEDV